MKKTDIQYLKLISFISDDHPYNPFDGIDEQELNDWKQKLCVKEDYKAGINKMLYQALIPLEREVIVGIYGLKTGKPASYEDIARKMGFTHRVSYYNFEKRSGSGWTFINFAGLECDALFKLKCPRFRHFYIDPVREKAQKEYNEKIQHFMDQADRMGYSSYDSLFQIPGITKDEVDDLCHNYIVYGDIIPVSNEDITKHHDHPICEAKLPEDIVRELEDNGVFTIGVLTKFSYIDLLKLKNLDNQYVKKVYDEIVRLKKPIEK